MTDRMHRFLMPMLGLLALGLAGCASGSGSTYSAWRPPFGGWQANRPGANGPARSWNGPQVLPGAGLQPTPLMQPPSIQPGPALPDASGRKFPTYPESAATRRPPMRRMLPPIVPHPRSGDPIARQPIPSEISPAELSGDIEIIPGPTLRARRARMDLLPPPPADAATNQNVEVLSTPDQGRFEALPPPD